MSDASNQPARVGVRELRQNLSVYLQRVKDGEILDVTEHGHPVARLERIPEPPLVGLAKLEAEGHIKPATRDRRSLPLPPSIPGRPLSEILQEMRDEDPR